MTENEAIEELKKLYPKKCMMVDGRLKGGFDDHESNGGIAIDMAIQALEKQMPTAYDVDKVVKDLETDVSVKLYGSGNSDNYLIPVKRAGEIARKGGITND